MKTESNPKMGRPRIERVVDADMLRAAREAKRLTVQEAADLVGVSKQAFSQWENGERPVPVDRASDIIKAMGMIVWTK